MKRTILIAAAIIATAAPASASAPAPVKQGDPYTIHREQGPSMQRQLDRLVAANQRQNDQIAKLLARVDELENQATDAIINMTLFQTYFSCLLDSTWLVDGMFVAVNRCPNGSIVAREGWPS